MRHEGKSEMKIEARVRWRCPGGSLVALLAVCACTPPPGSSWTKEGGVTQDELKRDQKACVAESGNYGFLLGPNSGPSGAADQQADIYRACMAQKGYGPAAPDTSPPAGSDEAAQ